MSTPVFLASVCTTVKIKGRQLAAAGKMSTVVDAGDDALEAGRSWGNVYCSRCR